jgi:hypothetical protein
MIKIGTFENKIQIWSFKSSKLFVGLGFCNYFREFMFIILTCITYLVTIRHLDEMILKIEFESS